MTDYLRGVQQGELDDVLPHVRRLFRIGLRRVAKRHSLEQLEDALKTGRRQLWVLWPSVECVLVTQIDIYPGAKVLHLFLVAGKLPRNWRELLAYVQRWGISEGCTEIEGGGDDRPGWQRMLRASGFRVACVMMRREL